ncbi:hypothetical protein I4F81_006759 [Pyropia yezoensis]|uniref:Uncharacterized protein n=1 Tax=Pyropia yezoensis TaxID=2788 RepID=A0ACC3C255_PYRYE|nr:hypothetical protein I4F81_006759 [Neopyropia yezoensis]
MEALLNLPQGDSVFAEYVWIDGYGKLRSKGRTLTRAILTKAPTELPKWNYDGSSTSQAPGSDSEVILRPQAVFKDPFRAGDNLLVMCDTYTPAGEPLPTNSRYSCAKVQEAAKEHEPWFGLEQEYFLTNLKTGRPLGFPDDGSEPEAQKWYYCGVGAKYIFGRQIVEAHWRACIYAGISISGINGEVACGQWEFQVGPVTGVAQGDQMWMARYILERIAETAGVGVDYSAKPVKGDWNGSGCHSNFSTAAMRAPGGYENAIIPALERLALKHELHIKNYGDNTERLTGKHETASMEKFTWGAADRGASCRVGHDTVKEGCGYLEDRRPSGDVDSTASTDSDDAVDVSDVLSSGVEALALFPSNADDPVLAAGAAADGADPDAVYDEEELSDVLLRPTDALVIAAVAEEDASLLAFHVVEPAVSYGDDGAALADTDEEEGRDDGAGERPPEVPYTPHAYVHHDLILPAFPLATAWTDGRVGGVDAGGSYVAVGSFGPAIDVFDVNAMDSLEAVREYLASGSADSTVKVWDAETGVAATTLGHHADKVQAVAWSPVDDAALLTASFDGRLAVVDVRAPPPPTGGGAGGVRLSADVEAAAWLVGGAAAGGGVPPVGTAVAVTTEDGVLALHDVRRLGGAACGGGGRKKKGKGRAAATLLGSVVAHAGAATAMAQSSALPGLLVTGGTDKYVRVWDVAALAAAAAADGGRPGPPPPSPASPRTAALWERNAEPGDSESDGEDEVRGGMRLDSSDTGSGVEGEEDDGMDGRD